MTTMSSPLNSPLTLANRFVFDPQLNTITDLTDPTEDIRLGGNESRILAILASKPNEIFTRQDLHEQVWRAQGFEVDDSSLTQAVSTLRKQLKDSTKSPEFIKTVPKLGYKLICSVEITPEPEELPLAEDVTEEPNTLETQQTQTEIRSAENAEPVVQPEPETKQIDTTSQPTVSAPQKASTPVYVWMILAISIIFPLLGWFSSPAPKSSFRTVAEFNGVSVQTPVNHPSLQRWVGSIEQCVTRYIEVHQEQRKPVRVIATGGQQNTLVLNYIHDLAHPEESVTLRLFSSQADQIHICQ